MNTIGFWEPITSTYDWCETNYAISYFVAEFFNTLSSIPIFFAGIYGLRNCMRFQYESKFYVMYTGLLIVGLGSVIFHATLTRAGQVLDEIPMLWAALSFLYVSCTLNCQPSNNYRYRNYCFYGFTSYAVISTIIYFNAPFAIFVVSYVFSAVGIVFSSIWNVRQSFTVKSAVKFQVIGVIFYAGAFFVFWLPEQIICGNRLFFHHSSIIMQVHLHAWFHISSTIGPYYYVLYLLFVRYHILKRRPKVLYKCGLIPVLSINLHDG